MNSLTIRFLEPSTGRTSSVFLGLAATWIRDQEITIVCDQCLSELILGALIHIFGMVGHNGLGNGGSNGVNL
jgi:hypothetical protein